MKHFTAELLTLFVFTFHVIHKTYILIDIYTYT